VCQESPAYNSSSSARRDADRARKFRRLTATLSPGRAAPSFGMVANCRAR